MRRFLFAVLVLAATASTAVAEGIRIVRVPDVIYFDVQTAVNTAVDGDILLVGTGSYTGFTVDGKGLTIAAMTGAQAQVNGTVSVRNVPQRSTLQMFGLHITAESGEGDLGLSIIDNSGHVRLMRCFVTGGVGDALLTRGPSTNNVVGGDGVLIMNSERVVLSQCTITGGDGGYVEDCFGVPPSGGAGVRTTSSSVVVHDGAVTGGRGAEGIGSGGTGGPGLLIASQEVYLSGVTVTGGPGGLATDLPECAFNYGDGGDGLVIGNGAEATILDVDASGGMSPPAGTWLAAGEVGQSVVNAGTLDTMPGPARRLVAPTIAVGGELLELVLTGVAGDDAVLITQRRGLGFEVDPGLFGVRLVGTPYTRVPLATNLPAVPQVVSLFLPECTNPEAQVLTVQALLGPQSPTGGGTLTGAASFVALDRDASPDCNGNGVLDFADIALGTSLDSNGNLLPDECDYQGPVWYVDAGGSPSGFGSASQPFPNLQLAFGAASDGHTIVVADGTYTGPQNRALDFGGREFVVRSANGADACILDAGSQANVFRLSNFEGPGARIEGFTIRNGSAIDGGGIFLSNTSPVIQGCTFQACFAARDGGAIHIGGGAPRIEGCLFQTNQASIGGGDGDGGGALYMASSDGVVIDCDFESNISSRGGGAIQIRPAFIGVSTAQVSHCTFRGNSGPRGGAIQIYALDVGSSSPTRITNCLMVGNSAGSGGGIVVRGGTVEIALCTIVANTSNNGGALSERDGFSDIQLSNSILWGNAAMNGSQIKHDGGGSLNVSHCDVQGGFADVLAVMPSLIQWDVSNVDADPMFGVNEHHLSATSPCIDAGGNALLPPDRLDLDGDGDSVELLPFDLDFAARRSDDPAVLDTGGGPAPIVDMGAFERQAI